MAHINSLIQVIILLSTAIRNSDYKSVRRLLVRVQIMIRKLRHDLVKTCKAVKKSTRNQQLDLFDELLKNTVRKVTATRRENGESFDENDIEYVRWLKNLTEKGLQGFLQRRQMEDERFEEALEEGNLPPEFLQVSHFQYDDITATKLAEEALAVAGDHGRIGCITTPAVYRKLLSLKPDTVDVKFLDSDESFEIFGRNFIFYDFEDPLDLDPSLHNYFDVVVVDLPFLTEECLTQTAITIKYLAKDKIILCTDATMESLSRKLLQVLPCQFRPPHQSHLKNEFLCYTNYDGYRMLKTTWA